jgi:hypothetical protein
VLQCAGGGASTRAGNQKPGDVDDVYAGGVSPFANFVYSFAAARTLLHRAYKTGSLIEAMVLYVSLIDGLLRIALVLDKQLSDGGTGDLDSYISQVPGGVRFTERAIYSEARGRKLIGEALMTEIIDLNEKRNATIYRFFLTDLKYADLEPLLNRYELVFDQCAAVVAELESRQIRDGKGMTTEGPDADPQELLIATNTKLGVDSVSSAAPQPCRPVTP